MKVLYKILIFVLFVFFYMGFSLADEYHYENILVGGRAADMGGAYVAISDDPVGCYYNPAGIVYSMGTNLSVSANVYNFSVKKYKSVLTNYKTGERYDWTLFSTKLIPNFFGIVVPFGPGKLGFSTAVPDSTFRDQHQTFYDIKSVYVSNPIARYIIDIYDVDNMYLAGPSYALEIKEGLAVGLTLYGYYRDRDIIRNHLLTLKDGQFEWSNFRESFTELGLKPILGFMLSPLDRVSLGLTFSRMFTVYRSYSSQTIYRGPSVYMNYGLNDIYYEYSESSDKEEYPYKIAAGIALFLSESLLFAGDISYYTKTDRAEAVFNIFAGCEVYLSEKIAVRLGFYTDNANTPDVSGSSVNQKEHVDLYGVTGSVSYFTRTSGTTLFFRYQYGVGEAQIITGSTAVQDLEMQSLSVGISTIYYY